MEDEGAVALALPLFREARAQGLPQLEPVGVGGLLTADQVIKGRVGEVGGGAALSEGVEVNVAAGDGDVEMLPSNSRSMFDTNVGCWYFNTTT